jgi:hypothetical protein
MQINQHHLVLDEKVFEFMVTETPVKDLLGRYASFDQKRDAGPADGVDMFLERPGNAVEIAGSSKL